MKNVLNSSPCQSLEEKFIKEQNRLKDIVYDEIELLEKKEATDIKCSLEMLKDAIFVIDKGFADIIKGINEHNLIEKENKLNLFRESLIYSIYGK